jgi:hypothetical protein
MYVAIAQMERNCLRQGDVLDALPFPIMDSESAVLGKIDHESGIQIPHPKIVAIPREHRSQKDCLTMQIKTRLSPAAVVAHCCELELRSEKCLLPMIAAARLVPVKPSIMKDSEKILSLRANKDPRNAGDSGFLDYFYLSPHEVVGGIEWVVDFSQITSIPGAEYQYLLRRKVLQLLDRERVKFKIKLAAYLGRLTDEEHSLGLENPWLDGTTPLQVGTPPLRT